MASMSEPWYADGLRFRCTRCGNCCTGPPGVVWVNDAEIHAIAQLRGEAPEEVRGLYTRQVGLRRRRAGVRRQRPLLPLQGIRAHAVPERVGGGGAVGGRAAL